MNFSLFCLVTVKLNKNYFGLVYYFLDMVFDYCLKIGLYTVPCIFFLLLKDSIQNVVMNTKDTVKWKHKYIRFYSYKGNAYRLVT